MVVDTPIVNEEKVKETKARMISDTEIYSVSDFFKIFGDSTRIRILFVLFEVCVCDLFNVVEITKSAASNQLNILKANKLVKFKKQGKNVIYMLDDEHVLMIIETARKHLGEK